MTQLEDAEKILVRFLREKPSLPYGNRGYDLYVSDVIRWTGLEQGESRPDLLERRVREFSPVFYDAAWELCRRGLIRPGARHAGLHPTAEAAGGEGYSMTPFGRQWLQEPEHSGFVPTDSGRFAELIEPHTRFGPGFHERALQAQRCHQANAFLACCAMCGAAAESVLLAAAIAQRGDEKAVLDAYRASGGRERVLQALLGQVNQQLRERFNDMFRLLSHWRDESTHGKASELGEAEAHQALVLLLRLAGFVSDNWELLTRSSSGASK